MERQSGGGDACGPGSGEGLGGGKELVELCICSMQTLSCMKLFEEEEEGKMQVILI